MQAKMHAPMKNRAAPLSSRGRTAVRVFASVRSNSFADRERLSVVPGVGPKLEALLKSQGCGSVDDLVRVHQERNSGDAERTKAWLMDVVGIRTRTAVKGIVDYLAEQKRVNSSNSLAGYAGALVTGGNGASSPHDAIVLGVLQNYSGLTMDRLSNLLRNSGRFTETQSTLNSILRNLESQGKVKNDNGTYRFVSNRAPTPKAARSPSPRPAVRSSSYSPAPARPSSAPRNISPARAASPSASFGAGSGASAGDETVVLDLLKNYAGLTLERASNMLRSTGKFNGNLSSVLNGLVSKGLVQNDNGTYKYISSGRTPVPARSASPTARSSPRPTSSFRPASPTASVGGGAGAAAGDETIVLSLLKNYAGLTVERATNMLRQTGKFNGSVSSVLNSLVSKGLVANEGGVYKYVSSGRTPAAARSSSPTARAASPRSSSGFRSASPTASVGGGSGAAAGDEATVMGLLKNYAGLTADRAFNMLRSTGKFSGSQSTVSSILNSLVSKGLVQNDNGTYRFVSGGRSATPTRSSSPTARITPRSASPTASFRPASPTASVGGGSGAAAGDEAVVLGLLKNYAGLTADRAYNMLRSTGKFSGSQSTVSSILNSLASRGIVQNDNGTYRYVSSGRTPTPARSSSPTARVNPRSASPTSSFRSTSPTASVGGGSGAAAGDEATVLNLLKNYAGLTADRASNMLRSTGKFSGNVTSVLNGLVSKGLVANEGGVYKYISSGRTPAAARSSSPTARAASPRSSSGFRSASPTASVGGGSGAAAGDEAVVLNLLKNYAGLTADRAFNMLRSTGKFSGSQSTVSSILNSLASRGTVQNDNGIYRYVSSGRTPTPARSSSPASYSAARSVSPARTASPARSSGSGAASADEAVVLNLLKNYAGLTADRAYNMLRSTGKFSGSQSTVTTILNSLVSQGKVRNDRGTYRF